MRNIKTQLLKVSANKRFLVREDGSPFFWLADTAWELFHKLDREEAEIYLKNRAHKGFNVIQAVALAEQDGLDTGNAYGRKPLLKNSKGVYDPRLPDETIGENGDNYDYWKHVDYIVDLAALYGVYIAFLPTWGDKFYKLWGIGPEIFDADNARAYGEWLGNRYRDKSNIIWVLGGDRNLPEAKHFAVIENMAKGIKKGDGSRHLITFHPRGGQSSAYHFPEADWLDFIMIQSGHGYQNHPNYNHITSEYDRQPVKPVLDGEPRYEDIAIHFKPENGYFDDADIRQAAYWAVLAGAFGHTYGHNSVWIMNKKPADDIYIMNWKTALMRPGSSQMQYLKQLIESRPFFERIPDQDLIAENYPGANHLQAARGDSYCFVYTPNGLPIKVNMGRISGETINAFWYSPRNGDSIFIGVVQNNGTAEFTPPTSGRGNDWILVLDDASQEFDAPGNMQ
jgi:hypothetical protein